MTKYLSILRTITGTVLALLVILPVLAQPKPQWSSAEIKQALEKSQVLGTVLYLAAHPDDENTRLISYLSNERHYRTAYLSLTRGDGGQNLVGTEKGAEMGLLRTQELLQARKIDGGEQFFTRAVDFGYSKNAEETLEIWEKEKVLADAVYVIRKFRPDVIVLRFPPNSRAGHGHHTTSALLAEEAFDLAGDPKAYPEQLSMVEVWQPKRLLFNTSTWWDKTIPEQAKTSDEFVMVDIGAYNPVLGISYAEIAAESRSQHKSQGFGSGKSRGTKLEYMKHVKGDKAKGDLMSGVDVSWNRVPGSDEVKAKLVEASANFQMDNPAATIPTLLKVHQLLEDLEQTHYVVHKKKEVQELILACAGYWSEATAASYSAAAGDEVELRAFAINRSDVPIKLRKVIFAGEEQVVGELLKNNEGREIKQAIELSGDHDAQPYWLRSDFMGVFQVDDPKLIGDPENQPALEVELHLEIEGMRFVRKEPVYYKWTDRVDGELYRPFVPMPAVTLNLDQKVMIFPGDEPQTVQVILQAHKDGVSGKAGLEMDDGWRVEPTYADYSLEKKGQEIQLKFKIFPPSKGAVSSLKAYAELNSKKYNRSLVTIEYPHVLTQTLLPEAKAKMVRLDLKREGKSLGYIMGAGDEVPQNLEQLGYQVTMLDEEGLRSTDLSQFDAIISGIRAYNTEKYLARLQPKLMEYVQNGGTYLVQYNTNRGLVTEDIGPYPMKLSRSRVTKEEAEATLLNSQHRLMTTPNAITDADFDQWVQERGLYFAGEWDERYTPLIAWNDPGEDAQKGGLLVANYGKGVFIYSGISFFRQLPAGVPGAFRLLVNLIDAQNEESNGQ